MATDFQIVLIAGSRNWSDPQMIVDVIETLLDTYTYRLLILDGGCPTGADIMAQNICAHRNVPNITMHAHWSFGRSAGPVRNRWMARLRPVEAHLFFQTPDSRGTLDMLKACNEYSIPTQRYRPSETTCRK